MATYWIFHAFVWRFYCCSSQRKSRGERIISLLIPPLISHTIHSHSPLSAGLSISFLCLLYFGIQSPCFPSSSSGYSHFISALFHKDRTSLGRRESTCCEIPKRRWWHFCFLRLEKTPADGQARKRNKLSSLAVQHPES